MAVPSLSATVKRRRRPDLELLTFAVSAADDDVNCRELRLWLTALTAVQRQEVCSDQNPWLASILVQMGRYAVRKGEALHAVDKNTDRDLTQCRLEDNFLSKQRNEAEFSVKLLSERQFSSHLRLSRSSSSYDTLTVSSELASSPSLFISLLEGLSSGQALSLPCKAVWSHTEKVWLRESPAWLRQTSNSLAQYAAAAIETAVWFAFWHAKQINARRNAGNQSFTSEPISENCFIRRKTNYCEFWKEAGREKREEIVGSAEKAVEGYEKSQESDEFACVLAEHEGDDGYLALIAKKMREYNSVRFAERLFVADDSLIDTVFLSPLERVGSLCDFVARRISERFLTAYELKSIEDLLSLADADQERPAEAKRGKAAKPRVRKQRPTVVPESTPSPAAEQPKQDEDARSYVQGLASRLLAEAITSQTEAQSAEWPLLLVKKKNKKKRPKRKPSVVQQPPVPEPPKPVESRKDRLTKDIEKFCSDIDRAVSARSDARAAVVAAITAVCQQLFPDCRVVVYGSVATGLSLPHSDVDLYLVSADIRSREEVTSALHALSLRLAHVPIVSAVHAIPLASIPVIKLNCSNDVKVDCSFDTGKHNGTQSSVLCIEAMGRFPPLKRLALVLKSILHASELNSSFFGGLSSYQLTIWLIAFLQRNSAEATEGALLMEFLRFFGEEFNPKTTGISAYWPPPFFPLDSGTFAPVVTLDPVFPDVNLTRNCTAVMEILHVFARCHAALIALQAEKRKKGFISTLLAETSSIRRG